MNQFKIQKIDYSARDKEMLKDSINDFSDNFDKTENPGNLIWVCIEYDNEPRDVEDRKKKEPGSLASMNNKVACKIKGNKQSI